MGERETGQETWERDFCLYDVVTEEALTTMDPDDYEEERPTRSELQGDEMRKPTRGAK